MFSSSWENANNRVGTDTLSVWPSAFSQRRRPTRGRNPLALLRSARTSPDGLLLRELLRGRKGKPESSLTPLHPGPSGQFVSAEPDLEGRRSTTRAMSLGLTTNDVKSDKGDGRIGASDGSVRTRSGSVLNGRRLLVIPQLEEAVPGAREDQPFEAAEGNRFSCPVARRIIGTSRSHSSPFTLRLLFSRFWFCPRRQISTARPAWRLLSTFIRGLLTVHLRICGRGRPKTTEQEKQNHE